MYPIFETPDGPPNSTRVIIIGGGAAGLSALAAMKKTPGTQVLLLEKQSDIGGVWLSSNYPRLSTHIKSYAYRFHDFRAPKCQTEYATRDEVLAYFSDYVKESDLESSIATGIKVRTVTATDKVRVEAERSNGDPLELHADFVVCALGFANAGQANIPTFKNETAFRGEIIHSSQFDAETLERVRSEKLHSVILGGGKSAYDLAVLMQEKGLTERASWVYRKFLWGLNHEMVYSNDPSLMETSFLAGQFLHLQRRKPNTPEVNALAEKIRASGLYLNLDDNLDIHQFRGAHYKTEEIKKLRHHFKRIQSSIRSLGESSVQLENEEEIRADLIICATGYTRAANLPQFQVAQNGTTQRIDPRDRKLLYRAMVDDRLPRVLFFTGETTFPSHLYGFSISSRWLPFYMRKLERGEISKQDMKTQTDDDDQTLNGGVDPEFEYSWIPNKGRNLSGGYDYSSLEAANHYRSQIYTDLNIPRTLQAQIGFSLFQPKLFEGMNDALHDATKTLSKIID